MSVLGWILAAILGAFYVAVGSMKVMQSRDKLLAQPNMAWVGDFPASTVKAIGALEVLGAVGVVLPWLVDVAPVLTPIAAVGLAVVQLGAIATHLRRHESKPLPINVVLLVLAVVVAVIRFGQL